MKPLAERAIRFMQSLGILSHTAFAIDVSRTEGLWLRLLERDDLFVAQPQLSQFLP